MRIFKPKSLHSFVPASLSQLVEQWSAIPLHRHPLITRTFTQWTQWIQDNKLQSLLTLPHGINQL